MAVVKVSCRGLFAVALGELRARIFFPRADSRRVASGSDRVVLPNSYAFLAVPRNRVVPSHDEQVAVRPSFSCHIRVPHHYEMPTERLRVANLKHVRLEMLTRSERVLSTCDVPQRDQVLYDVYLLPDHHIRIPALEAEQPALRFSLTPVRPDGRNAPDERSMLWLPRLKELSGAVLRDDIRSGEVPGELISAFIDFTAGEMTPVLYPDHVWRFMHAKSRFKRMIADQVEVSRTIDEDSFAVELTCRSINETKQIMVASEGVGDLIVGNEPLHDILELEAVYSCAEPSYQFEAHYALVEGSFERLPVPLCVNENDDHRSRPEGACGPPALIEAPE